MPSRPNQPRGIVRSKSKSKSRAIKKPKFKPHVKKPQQHRAHSSNPLRNKHRFGAPVSRRSRSRSQNRTVQRRPIARPVKVDFSQSIKRLENLTPPQRATFISRAQQLLKKGLAIVGSALPGGKTLALTGLVSLFLVSVGYAASKNQPQIYGKVIDYLLRTDTGAEKIANEEQFLANILRAPQVEGKIATQFQGTIQEKVAEKLAKIKQDAYEAELKRLAETTSVQSQVIGAKNKLVEYVTQTLPEGAPDVARLLGSIEYLPAELQSLVTVLAALAVIVLAYSAVGNDRLKALGASILERLSKKNLVNQIQPIQDQPPEKQQDQPQQ